MKKHIFTLLLITAVFAVGCKNYGKMKTFDGVEVYYTENVTEAQADSLGNFLVTTKFADGDRKTVQLNKTGNTYEFRMVIKKGIDQDQEMVDHAKIYAAQMSATLFHGAEVDVHFCDDQLKTIRVIPMAMHTDEPAQ